jgi:hypothetical protein
LVHVSSRLTTTLVVTTSIVTACRQQQPERTADCLPERGVEVWVERRFPPTVQVADTAFASLSITIARDSVAPLPDGSMISVVIAGPSAAPLPDTVRVLSAEQPSGASLWRGDQLRPGRYTAQLSNAAQVAGPRSFALAPGERVEIETRLHQAATCSPDSARAGTAPNDSARGR